MGWSMGVFMHACVNSWLYLHMPVKLQACHLTCPYGVLKICLLLIMFYPLTTPVLVLFLPFFALFALGVKMPDDRPFSTGLWHTKKNRSIFIGGVIIIALCSILYICSYILILQIWYFIIYVKSNVYKCDMWAEFGVAITYLLFVTKAVQYNLLIK